MLKMEALEPLQKKPRKRGMSSCVGCGCPITDQFILRVAPDLEWHATCLKCAECGCHLDETCTCFVRDGKTYCKPDYLRLFGAKCAKCTQGFSKNDFVMRARNKIYHIDCFRCVACSRQLIPGDEFALRDDGLLCKADNDIVERSTNNNNSPSGEDLEDSSKDNMTTLSEGKSEQNSPEPQTKSERSHPRKDKPHKTTRVRTVLNEKQLHTLRTCYNANPRPDALMKEQLVEMANLSPRVIRVWFQNKRCKDKKRSIFLKQMQQQQQDKQGVPMVASSPVRHEPPAGLGQNPIDVQSYQAPWKALSDFAMGPGGDLDAPPGQAPFQQLVSAFGDNLSDDDSVVVTQEEELGGAGVVVSAGSTAVNILVQPPQQRRNYAYPVHNSHPHNTLNHQQDYHHLHHHPLANLPFHLHHNMHHHHHHHHAVPPLIMTDLG